MEVEARKLTEDAVGHLVRVDGETFLLGSYCHRKRTNSVILEEVHSEAQTDTHDFFSMSVNFHAAVEIPDSRTRLALTVSRTTTAPS